MTGVLKVRQGGAWVDIMVPGPQGPTGPQGIQGPQGPAGPQQQAALTGTNSAYLAVGAAAWTEYGISTISLPYSGKWLVRASGSISLGGAGSGQVCVGIDHTNQWYASAPWMETAGAGTWQLSVEGVFTLTSGSHIFAIYSYLTVAGACRFGNCTVSYFGP